MFKILPGTKYIYILNTGYYFQNARFISPILIGDLLIPGRVHKERHALLERMFYRTFVLYCVSHSIVYRTVSCIAQYHVPHSIMCYTVS